MKASILFTLIVAAVAPLAACESSNATRTADASDTRNVYVAGNGSDRNVTVPTDRTQSTDAPYALRGNSQPADSTVADHTNLQGTNSR